VSLLIGLFASFESTPPSA